MSLINRARISRLLMPGIKAIFGKYKIYEDQWKQIYKVYQSDRATEMDLEMQFSGYADFKDEGQPVSATSMGQGTVTNYIHKRVGLSFDITREAVEDNLYKERFPQYAVALRDSLRVTKDILGANILNNAFSVDALRGDGVPLCSTAHPVEGGVYANTFAVGATADLSEVAAEEAIIAIQTFPMLSGLLSQTKVKKLLIGPRLQFIASILFNSAFRPGSGNNDINPLNYNNYLPEGFTVNQYINSPSAWFFLTDAQDGFKHYERVGIEIESFVEDRTQNITYMATERYSFGCSNPRAVFGSKGV